MSDVSLYLIPTPVGNYLDITLRAIDTLKMVDLVLCEDTRETSKLLSKYDIKKKLVSCHEFNENSMKNKVLEYLNQGLNIGLVTDQGTPLISDPGYRVVSFIVEHGYNVVSLPGATAFVPALTLSALPVEHFLFYGFLNSKSSKRKSELASLKNYPYTLVFYEAPHRLVTALNDMKEILGDRKICVVKEISKKYETVIRGKISDILVSNFEIKGEFVLVVEGNSTDYDYSNLSIKDHVNLYIADGMLPNEAIKKVAKERHEVKSLIYNEYHKDGDC